MKRILWLGALLALLLAALTVSAGAEISATPLSLNATQTAQITYGGQCVYFSFTPTETATYDTNLNLKAI